jgi:aminopeptidase
MENFLEKLDKYAQLTVTLGTNIQLSQTLFVRAPIESAVFVRKVVQKAYEAGAKHVYVEWSDDEVGRISYEMESIEGLKEFPSWKARQMEDLANGGAAFLTIYAPNPDLLKNIDAERISAANKARATAFEKFSDDMMADKVSWCLVSVPTVGWANKVFPGLPEKEQLEKLWDAIFMATRIHTEDPIAAWHEHVDNLRRRVEFLNEKKFKKLHYKANGTDLTIELPEGHMWNGGGAVTQGGIPFMPNIPTEEVFTLPLRSGVNGVVTSTKPLNYSGKYIENLSLRFENGRIIDVNADTELETLKKLIETDDGSHYLGEVALVPFDSPISNSNLIFANTLFDENASCHLAIGAAYPTCIASGTEMSREELDNRGVNNSLMHVDFMIGSNDMEIDGELADGSKMALFRNGNWAD